MIVPGVGIAGGVGYLLNDTFITNRAAGAVDSTAAEPGPGRRSVVDSGSKLSLSSGALVLASAEGARDPGMWYEEEIEKRSGRVLLSTFTINNNGLEIGWAQSVGGTGATFRLTGITLRIRPADPIVTVDDMSTGVEYQIAVVLRVPGSMYFISGGAFSQWTLVWISDATVSGNVYGTAHGANSGGQGSVAEIKVPRTLWLPAPLASDGFSSFGETDGQGHHEGVSGGLGSGGGGVTWSSPVGTWGVGGGVATATALSGGLAYATVDAGTEDVIITCEVTRTGGTAGIVVRWVDEDNHVQLRHTGTNIQLVKMVAGTPTTLIDTSATYVAGSQMRLVVEGTSFRAFYNKDPYGSDTTISDGALASATVVGLRTSDTGNTFDNLVVYARGTDGEYDTVLDAI
jgi:hypothetical protein